MFLTVLDIHFTDRTKCSQFDWSLDFNDAQELSRELRSRESGAIVTLETTLHRPGKFHGGIIQLPPSEMSDRLQYAYH